MSHRPVVFFFLPDLSGGGAERATIEYLLHLDRARFSPHLVLTRRHGVYLDRVPEDVPVHSLGKRTTLSLPRLIVGFRRLARALQPDLVYSSNWYADLIQLQARRRAGDWKAACSLHAVPRELRRRRFGSIKTMWMRRLYPRADAVFAVTASVAEEFSREFRSASEVPRIVQPNPFDLDEIRRLARKTEPNWPSESGLRVVALGRFEREKGFDLLIDALGRLADRSFHLLLLGEGPEREDLRARAEALDILDRVTFPGFLQNPYPAIRSADLFVLPSRSEAFPSVVIEALALGTPILATDCPTGPAEILEGGRLGRLVPAEDSEAMAEAIGDLLESPERLAQLRGLGKDSMERLDAVPVTRSFEERLAQVIARPF